MDEQLGNIGETLEELGLALKEHWRNIGGTLEEHCRNTFGETLK